ncbi:MAG: CoA ester lyase [Alphaproteobacteria bacterium]|nr:CoA ester lyase [Alphaproteobacteria bacterium]
MRLLRSFLFVPGNHSRKVEKVFGVGADAVILDLEDAVAIAEKPATRATVVEALKKPHRSLGYIRVNALDTEYCYGDFHAIVGPWLDGIMVPKVEAADQLKTVDWLLAQIERERGLAIGTIDILPIIETGLGLHRIDEICGGKTRVKRVSFGAGDFTRDMGLKWTGEEQELTHARARIVLASRVAGLEPPIDTVFIDLKDRAHLEMSTHTALNMGFQGKLCIHPDQVPLVNEIFTPTGAEIARAEKIIAAFKKAEAEGSASIQVDGYFVDYPIVVKAQRVLDVIARIRAAAARP